MGEKYVLDLRGINILGWGDDEVGGGVENIEKGLLMFEGEMRGGKGGVVE